MRKIIAAIAAISALSTAALAADLPVKAPPLAPAPIPTWTGCYIGGNIGGAFGDAKLGGVWLNTSGGGSGFAGGGQIGCDYQFNGGWVIGIRDMFDVTGNKSSRRILAGPLAGNVTDFKNQWFDTLTGRLGYAVSPATLSYFQGGGAWVNTKRDVIFAGVPINLASNSHTGWTIGGGVEYKFIPHRSVFLEGNYMDFGSRSGVLVTGLGTVCAPGCAFNAKASESTVLAGVNYRF